MSRSTEPGKDAGFAWAPRPPDRGGGNAVEGVLRRARTLRWGTMAPPMLRIAALIAWAALVTRLLSVSLPGSRTGIEGLIRRADTTSSVLSWALFLVGASQLVMLLMHTLSERTLGFAYRILVVPFAATVLLLVALSTLVPLEPEQNLALGAACLVLSGSAAIISVRSRIGRAHGLVLLAVTLGASARFSARVMELGLAGANTSWASGVLWVTIAGRLFDALAVSLTAVRFVAERRAVAGAATLTGLALGTVLAWGGLRGSFDGAAQWQVLASRSLGDLAGSGFVGALRGNYAVEAFALLLGGIVACFPARLSLGLLSATFAVLARPSVDVPACALVLAQGALMSTLCHTSNLEPRVRIASPSGGRTMARNDA